MDQSKGSGQVGILVYTFLASGDFCHLLITFANSLDPDKEDRIQTA